MHNCYVVSNLAFRKAQKAFLKAAEKILRRPRHLLPEPSAQADGNCLVEHEEAALGDQVGKVSAQSDGAYLAEGEEAVREAQFIEVSPQYTGTCPA